MSNKIQLLARTTAYLLAVPPLLVEGVSFADSALLGKQAVARIEHSFSDGQ